MLFVTNDEPVLRDVRLSAEDGKLLGVAGKLGAGKSSLLLSIAGETKTLKVTHRILSFQGFRKVRGQIAYVEQEPFLIAGTIRDNILFGLAYDDKKMNEVLQASHLIADLQDMPDGLETKIADRGSTLSGGQRARITLARYVRLSKMHRALYQDADIYLLDDPLSAVDANVGRHIFHKCIREYLRNKCVVLATHQVHFLAEVDCSRINDIRRMK